MLLFPGVGLSSGPVNSVGLQSAPAKRQTCAQMSPTESLREGAGPCYIANHLLSVLAYYLALSPDYIENGCSLVPAVCLASGNIHYLFAITPPAYHSRPHLQM